MGGQTPCMHACTVYRAMHTSIPLLDHRVDMVDVFLHASTDCAFRRFRLRSAASKWLMRAELIQRAGIPLPECELFELRIARNQRGRSVRNNSRNS